MHFFSCFRSFLFHGTFVARFLFFFNFSCFYSVKCRALLNTLTLLNLNTVGRVSNLLFYLNCTIEQFDHKTLCAHGNHTLALKESLRKKNEIGLTREKKWERAKRMIKKLSKWNDRLKNVPRLVRKTMTNWSTKSNNRQYIYLSVNKSAI